MMLPLSALLSQVLVALTIESDNEFEHRMPHRTSRHGRSDGPWLTSMVMYLNCMQFLTDQGLLVRELEALARTRTNLDGMRRWGYVVIQDPIRRNSLIRPTGKGKQAQEVWKSLFEEIEQRWRDRFGASAMERLRDALAAIVAQIEMNLPDCLPILG